MTDIELTPADLGLALDEIVRTVSTTVLELDAVRVDASPDLDDELVARVDIAGSWVGSLIVRAAGDLADVAARVMFGGDDIGDAEREDAVGELANVVAGNLAPLVAAPARLSVPVVPAGRAALAERRQVARAQFVIAGRYALTVAMLEETPCSTI
jgi:CheY-specific phosphatase CheX|nr:chemotaxis protein CheX [Kofleriaceae bacterium]